MKLLCLYLVQHLLHLIKAQPFSSDLDLYKQCKVLENRRIQGIFKDFEFVCLFVLLLYVPSQQLWSLRDGQFT